MSEAAHNPEPDRPSVRPTDVGPSPADPDRVAKGGYLGPYRLLSVLGEGGFGRVWLAERREPIVQRVAIKIIKAGMDSRAVIARFEQERQALAVMDHPCIAKVHDAGTTPAGHPYFVMEHVSGEPITAFCDRHNFSIRQRLELVVPLCEAVQHAHHKGIIHRDIKPSNVLVSIQDEKPSVKIIDFGVAKAISHTLTDKTIFTEQGQIIGTPEYMSPEQAEMGAVDIDTRTDVYALGVLLYELLTGALPFDRKTLRSKGFGEIQRLIRESDPPKPSTRLTSLGGEADAVARHRQTSPATLAGELRNELEWIPLKAIRKDRAERYRTPIDLADDIKNYLDGRPLSAGPESAGYRLRKLIRRNRAPFLAGAVAAAALLIALAGVTIGLIRASAAERQAQAERDRAVAATAALQEQRDKLAQALNELRAEQQQKAAAQQETTQQLIQRQGAYAKLLQSAAAGLAKPDGGDPRAALNQCDPALRGWEWYMLWGLLDDAHISVGERVRYGSTVWLGPDDRTVYRLSHQTGLVEEFDLVSGLRRREWPVRVNDDPRLKGVILDRVVGMSRDTKTALLSGARENIPPEGAPKRRSSQRAKPPTRVFVAIDAASGNILSLIEAPTAPTKEADRTYWGAALSPDGAAVVLASRSTSRGTRKNAEDRTYPLQFHRSANGELIARCTTFASGTSDTTFSRDGSLLYIRAGAIESSEWAALDAQDGRELRRGSRDDSTSRPSYSLNPFTADGGIVLTGADGIHVQDVRTGTLRRTTLKGESGGEAVFSPSGARVFLSSRDYGSSYRNVRTRALLVDAADGRFVSGLRTADVVAEFGTLGHVEFTSDERFVLAAASSGAFAVWPTAAHDVLARIAEVPLPAQALVLSDDETQLVAASAGQPSASVSLPDWFGFQPAPHAAPPTRARSPRLVAFAPGAAEIDAAFAASPSDAPDAKPTVALTLTDKDRVIIADDRGGLSVWCLSTKQRLVRLSVADVSLAPQPERPASIAWMQMSTRTDRLVFSDTSGKVWVLSPADRAAASARSAVDAARTTHLIAQRVLHAIDANSALSSTEKELARHLVSLDGDSSERVSSFANRVVDSPLPDRRDLELAARLHNDAEHPAWPGRKRPCDVSARIALALEKYAAAVDALGGKDDLFETLENTPSAVRAGVAALALLRTGDADSAAIAASDTLPDLYPGPGEPVDIRPAESPSASRLLARVPAEVYGGVKPEEAWPAVKALFDRGLSIDAMIDEIKTLYPQGTRMRAAAIGLAARGKRAATRFNTAAWEASMGRVPRDEAGLKVAMVAAHSAVALQPDEPAFINTLAAVEFRAGLYAESLATLERGIALAKTQGDDAGWSDFALQAMNHAKLGHAAEARAALERLRAMQADISAREMAQAKPLLAEAEGLVHDLK